MICVCVCVCVCQLVAGGTAGALRCSNSVNLSMRAAVVLLRLRPGVWRGGEPCAGARPARRGPGVKLLSVWLRGGSLSKLSVRWACHVALMVDGSGSAHAVLTPPRVSPA